MFEFKCFLAFYGRENEFIYFFHVEIDTGGGGEGSVVKKQHKITSIDSK